MLHKEICIETSRRVELEYCLKKLQSYNTKVEFFEGKHFTTVAVNVDDALTVKIKELVAEIVVTRRKFEYLSQRLNIREYTPCLAALVSALVHFERQEECNRIIKRINHSRVFNINGIVDFRIGDLCGDWQELVELTNSLLTSGYTDVDIYNVASFMLSPRIKAEKTLFIADVNTPIITNVSRGGVVEVMELFHDTTYDIINTIIAECPSELIVEGELVDHKVVLTLKNLLKIKVI